jgi:hypothetical protein
VGGFVGQIVSGTPSRANLMEGAKGVQLAELGLKSWAERRWIDVPDLTGITNNSKAA